MSDLVLGIDVGTSGVRIAAIDQAAKVVAFTASPMPPASRDDQRITQDASVWERGLGDAMARLASTIDLARVGALAVDGTSGTLVGVDDRGTRFRRAAFITIAPMLPISPRSNAPRHLRQPSMGQPRRWRGRCVCCERLALQEFCTRPTGSRPSFPDASMSVTRVTP